MALPTVQGAFTELISLLAAVSGQPVGALAADLAWSEWIEAVAIEWPGRPAGELVEDRILDPEHGYGTETWDGVRKKVADEARELGQDGITTDVMAELLGLLFGSTFLCPAP